MTLSDIVCVCTGVCVRVCQICESLSEHEYVNVCVSECACLCV